MKVFDAEIRICRDFSKFINSEIFRKITEYFYYTNGKVDYFSVEGLKKTKIQFDNGKFDEMYARIKSDLKMFIRANETWYEQFINYWFHYRYEYDTYAFLMKVYNYLRYKDNTEFDYFKSKVLDFIHVQQPSYNIETFYIRGENIVANKLPGFNSFPIKDFYNWFKRYQ